MVKVKMFMVGVMVLALFSCYGGSGNPPFSRGVCLNYQGAELIIGYTTISYVNDVLGEPDESVVKKHGGDGFYWENMLKNTYSNGKLLLIFSRDKEVLIQIIFCPLEEDEYIGFLNINNQNGREEILEAVKKSSYNFTPVEDSTTIWIDYYERETPYLKVTCGLQFNDDQSLYALNYHVDAPW
jgi:hypothetical protein